MSNVAAPGCSEGDGARTGTGMMGDADGLEGRVGKVDITMPDKINKTSMLTSY